MTTPIEALRQALQDSLDIFNPEPGEEHPAPKWEARARAVLAAHDAQQQEPAPLRVLFSCKQEGHSVVSCEKWCGDEKACLVARTGVAGWTNQSWIDSAQRKHGSGTFVGAPRTGFGVPLYTHPSQDQADAARLRAFSIAILSGWPESSVDGFEIQDLAIEHGLLALKVPAPTKPCREEGCWCAEYHGVDFNNEFEEPVKCYTRTPLLLGEATKGPIP
jgi:hypothetical protein